MSADRHGILSAGTWALDRIKLVDAWPQEEHLAKILSTDMQGGGSGHNLAVDIRKLDATLPVETIGLLGVHKTMDSAWRDFDNGWQAVLATAKSSGIVTNLELVSISEEQIQALALPCLPYLDSLIINEYELSALSGINLTDSSGEISSDDCVTAATSLFDKGSMSLVVVHYPKSAIAVTSSGQVIIKPSFNVHTSWIRSSVGAGDAFAAGMLYGIHEEWSLENSLELGHACAAASLRATTTVGSVESVAECLKFARRAYQECIV